MSTIIIWIGIAILGLLLYMFVGMLPKSEGFSDFSPDIQSLMDRVLSTPQVDPTPPPEKQTLTPEMEKLLDVLKSQDSTLNSGRPSYVPNPSITDTSNTSISDKTIVSEPTPSGHSASAGVQSNTSSHSASGTQTQPSSHTASAGVQSNTGSHSTSTGSSGKTLPSESESTRSGPSSANIQSVTSSPAEQQGKIARTTVTPEPPKIIVVPVQVPTSAPAAVPAPKSSTSSSSCTPPKPACPPPKPKCEEPKPKCPPPKPKCSDKKTEKCKCPPLPDMSEYIRKDSIPCWACKL